MILKIKVITNAKQNKVEKIGDNNFKIYITQKPEKGKANEAVLKLLAKHLRACPNNIHVGRVARSQLKIKIGEKNKNKIIKMDLS